MQDYWNIPTSECKDFDKFNTSALHGRDLAPKFEISEIVIH